MDGSVCCTLDGVLIGQFAMLFQHALIRLGTNHLLWGRGVEQGFDHLVGRLKTRQFGNYFWVQAVLVTGHM